MFADQILNRAAHLMIHIGDRNYYFKLLWKFDSYLIYLQTKIMSSLKLDKKFIVFIHAKFVYCLFVYLGQSYMYTMLKSNSLCSWRWPWTCNLPSFTFWVLQSQQALICSLHLQVGVIGLSLCEVRLKLLIIDTVELEYFWGLLAWILNIPKEKKNTEMLKSQWYQKYFGIFYF